MNVFNKKVFLFVLKKKKLHNLKEKRKKLILNHLN